MTLSNKELEDIIKEQIEKETSNIDVPSFESQWEKIKSGIQADS
ncbi:MAG: hypothetical protein AB7E31_00060 [Desulfitobacterium sp.]